MAGRPDRREVIAGAAALAAAGAAAAQPASRPNLVLFFLDELRADALACYGNPVTKTPNFDALARSGTRFAECHVQNPVCAQSRCSLLTGWPTSVRGHRSLYYLLQPTEPNLFRDLKEGAYDVFWFGKNDALAQATFPGSVTRWGDIDHRAEYAALGKVGAGDRLASAAMLFPGGGDRRETGDYRLLQMAFEVLERREADRPFCLFLPLISPHPPYRAPQGFDGMYDPAKLPPLVPPGLPKKPSYFAGLRDVYGLAKVSDAELRRVRATYYAQVSFADWLLGEFLAALERTGRARDTAIFVASDHGDYAGDYGLIEKWPSGLESCLTHVPLIARMPGGAPGHEVGEMVELFDVMATMLELAGVKASHTHFARSLVPQLRGAPGDPKRAAFSEGGYNIYEPQAFEPFIPGLYGPKTRLEQERPATVQRAVSVKTPSHSLVLRTHDLSELYDRRSDPMETRNLFDSSAHADVREALKERLLTWYEETTGVPDTRRDPRDLPRFPAP